VDTQFDADTAVTRLEDGRFEAVMARRWWVIQGPNGGYVAAVLLRALADAVDDPDRAPRSLTVHYTAPPTEGPVTIATIIERAGRSLTTCSARMEQDGRLVALALAAFSRPRQGLELCDVTMPDVPPPELFAAAGPSGDAPPIAHCFDYRYAIGRPPWLDARPMGRAVVGGWFRLAEPRVIDAPLAAAMTDGWPAAVFGRVPEPVYVPTVDLTIHFRAALPYAGARPDDFVLASFRTNVMAEGFLDEDGELWSRDGLLLAQSRQLAVVLPVPAPSGASPSK
jgi:acyl-CoA thioesterase